MPHTPKPYDPLMMNLPLEIAERLKAQGIDRFNRKEYVAAVKLFTQAISARPTKSVLLEKCYLNRAACFLELSESSGVYSTAACIRADNILYPEEWYLTIRDTSEVLALSPGAEKACWRAARALFASGKLFDALDICEVGLKINPYSKDFPALKAKIEKGAEPLVAERQERERREKETQLAVERAIQTRKLIIRNTPNPESNCKLHQPNFLHEIYPSHKKEYLHPIYLVPEQSEAQIPLSGPRASTWQAPDPSRLLVIPVFLVYEGHDEMELIPQLREDLSIGETLTKCSLAPCLSFPKSLGIPRVNLPAAMSTFLQRRTSSAFSKLAERWSSRISLINVQRLLEKEPTEMGWC